MPKHIDIHNHILFKMDDGARNFRESARMIRAAVKDNIRLIVATPHVRPGSKRFDYEQYLLAIQRLNSYCIEKEYDLRIAGGAEILWNRETIRMLRQKAVPTMNQTRFVLVEWKISSSREEIFSSVRELTNAGYKVICAHVERYPSLRKRKVIESLKDMYDARIQIDSEAMTEKCSWRTRSFINRLLRNRLVDYVATDAHGLHNRPIRLNEAYRLLKKKYGKKYALSLTLKNQRELFAEEESLWDSQADLRKRTDGNTQE